MKHGFWGRSIAAVLLAGALAFGGLAGCGSDTIQSKEDLHILFIMPDIDDDFRNLLSAAIERSAIEEGVAIDKEYTGGTVDTQIDQIRAAEDDGYDVIVCYPMNPEIALKLEEAARDLPIVFVSNKPLDDYLTKDQYMFVGSLETEAGAYQAEYVWEKLGRPSEMNAVIFEGEPGHSGTVGRTAAVHEFFEEHHVAVDYVYEDYAYWSAQEAAEKFDIFLQTGQPFDAVFSNNDTMATGVVQVMQEYGLDTEAIPVVGVDGTEAGCQSIADGGMQFTVHQSADGQGEMSVKTAIALATAGTAEGIEGLDEAGIHVWVPFEPVDEKNVKDYLPK